MKKATSVITILLCLFASNAAFAFDLGSIFKEVIDAIARDSSENITESYSSIVKESKTSKIELLAHNVAGSVVLDWSTYVEKLDDDFKTYTVYRSLDRKKWTKLAQTKYTSYTDNSPYKQTNFYKVTAMYADYEHTSAMVPVNPYTVYAARQSSIASQTSTYSADKTISVSFAFELPSIEEGEQGYKVLNVSDLGNDAEVGEPLLPYKDTHILIPEGYELDNIEYIEDGKVEYSNLNLMPQQPAVPIADGLKFDIDDSFQIKTAAYTSNVPNDLVISKDSHELSGYKLMPIRITPAKYIPKDKKLEYFQNVTVKVNLKKTDQISVSSMGISSKVLNRASNMVKAMIANPEDLEVEKSIRRFSVSISSISHDMVIIGPASFEDIYKDFISFKASKGISAIYVSTEYIAQTQSGRDTQEKIRNYIKFAYQAYGIEYVILGADTEHIPPRKVPSYKNYGHYDDAWVHSDYYYSCLDGDWDANGNGTFGESADNPDRFAEVYIGRFPASNTTELQRMLAKSIVYQSMDRTTPYMKRASVYGEQLDSNTPASLYTNRMGPYLSQVFDTNTHRDASGRSVFIPEAQSNHAQMYTHLGHSSAGWNMNMGKYDVMGINNSLPYFIYTQGCYSTYFVYNDSIAEEHMKNQYGAHAFIGNSHYGWYRPGSSSGVSTLYEEKFHQAVFSGINELGKANAYSKENTSSYFGSVYRLLIFCITLLGDPSTKLVTEFTPEFGTEITTSFANWESGNVSINAKAIGDGLQSLKIQYRLGESDSWKDLDSTVSGELIYVLDTTQYADRSDFQLRSYAAYLSATAESTVKTFGIDNTKPSTTTPVQGGVYNENVTIELIPSDNLSGVNKTYYSVGNIVNRLYYNPIIISQGGDYTLTYYSIDNAGNRQNEVSVDFHLDKSIQEGFPIQLSGAIYGVPTYKDVDGDGFVEIAVMSNDGKAWLFNHDGTPVTGWGGGKTIGASGAASPAIADVDGDGQDEIVFFGSFGGLNVFETDGNLKWKALSTELTNNSSPVIADVNNDFKMDIILLADGKLYIFDGESGDLFPGYPKNITGESLDFFGTPAVGDMNGDGALEIAVAYSTSDDSRVILKVIRYDGVQIFANQYVASWMTASPVMADINGDGLVEVIFAGGQQPYVHVRNYAGNPLPGFSFVAPSGEFPFSPAIADIDGDGSLDIIIANTSPGGSRLYAINSQGNVLPGFPIVTAAALNSAPVIGDLDGDSKLDILIGGNNSQLYAYTNQGQLIADFPKTVGTALGIGATILDIDNDGKTDILAGDFAGKLNAWTTPADYHEDRIPWGTFQRDTYHTGYYPTLYFVSPAENSKVYGETTLRVKALVNSKWIKGVDFQYSLDSTNGVNGTWIEAQGIAQGKDGLIWDSEPKGGRQDVWLRARCLNFDDKYTPYVTRKVLVDNKAPEPPTNLTVNDPVDNGENLILNWTKSADDGAGLNDVLYYYIDVNDGSVTQTVQVNKGVTSYSVSTDKFHSYSFAIRAFDGVWYSTYDKSDRVTPNDETPPEVPELMYVKDVAADNGTALQISFSHSSDYTDLNEIAYSIMRSLSGQSDWTNVTDKSKANVVIDSSLSKGVTYDYKVVVTDLTNDAETGIKTGIPIDNLAPALPSTFEVADVPNDNGEAIEITWVKSADDGAGANDLVKYILEINEVNVELPAGTTSYVYDQAQKDVNYEVCIIVVDDAGNSNKTCGKSAYARDNIVPGGVNPSVVDVPEDQGGLVSVEFAKSADDGAGVNDVVAYSVYRRLNGNLDEGELVAQVTANGSENYQLNVGAPVLNTYEFQIKVFDGANQTASAWVEGESIDNIAPEAVTNLTGQDNPNDQGGAILVTWTRSSDDGSGADDVTTYTVYRKSTIADWVVAGTVSSGNESFVDTGLSNSVGYAYKMETKDSVNSSWTIPGGGGGWIYPEDNLAPDSVTLSAVDVPEDDGGFIQLDWTLNSGDTIGYTLWRDGQLIASFDVNTSSYIDEVPQNYVLYTYIIKAMDGTNESLSNEVQCMAEDNLANAAQIDSVEDVPNDQGGAVEIKWTQVDEEPNLASYELFRDGKFLTSLGSELTSHIDDTPTNNITYNYVIVAIDTYGNRATSDPVAGMAIDNIAPAAATGVGGADVPNDQGTALRVFWIKSADDGAGADDVEKYEIYRISPNEDWVLVGSTLNAIEEFVDGTVNRFGKYAYKVRTWDSINWTDNEFGGGGGSWLTPIDNLGPQKVEIIATDNPNDDGGKIQISWSANTDDTISYILLRDGQIIASFNTSVTNYLDEVPLDNVEYSYKVRAFDGFNNTDSDIAKAMALDNLAKAPVLISVEDVPADNGGVLELTWEQQEVEENASKYVVYRDNESLVTLDANVFTYLDTQASTNQQYTYKIMVLDTFGNTAFSNELSGISIDNIDPFPIELYGSDTPNDQGYSVDLSWSFDQYEAGVTYKILRDGVEIYTFTDNQTSYQDENVQPSKSYSYKITASDGSNTIQSNTVVVIPVDNLAPDFDKDISVIDTPDDNGGKLTVSWTLSNAPDVVKYTVYRSLDNVDFEKLADVGKDASKLDDVVDNVITYYYKVSVTDGTFVVMSNVASAEALDNIPPATVTNLVAIDTPNDQGGSISLSWTNPSESGLSYQLYRDDQLLKDNLSGVSYVDTPVNNGQDYSYYILVSDGTYQAKSEVVVAQASDNLVNGVSNLAVNDVPNDEGTALSLTWDNPADSDISMIKIERDSVEIAQLSKDTQTYQDNGLVPTRTYQYEVIVVDDDGNQKGVVKSGSPIDNIDPELPTNLTVTDPVDNGGVLHVSWTRSNSDDAAEVWLYRMEESQGLWMKMYGWYCDVTSHTDISLGASYYFGKKFSYKLVVFDHSGNQSETAATAFERADDEISPDFEKTIIVADVAADNGESLEVTWTKSNAPDVWSYYVYRSLDQVEYTKVASIASANSSYIDAVDKGVTYYYKVSVSDRTHEVFSDPGSGQATDDNPPEGITNFVVQDAPNDQGGSIWLSWTKPAESGLMYKTYRDGQLIDESLNRHSYVDNGLTKDQEYSYYVVVSDGTNDVQSETKSAVASDNVVNNVTNPQVRDVADDQGTAIRIYWTLPADDDLDAHRLYRDSQVIATLSANVTEYIDSGLNAGQGYIYQVETFDESGNSKKSLMVEARPVDNIPPEAPTNLVVTNPIDNGGVLNLTWDMSSSEDVIMHRLYRTWDGQTWTFVDFVSEGSFVDNGLVMDKSFSYKVIAYDRHNASESDQSPYVNPGDELAPSTVNVIAIDKPDDEGGFIQVSWTQTDDPYAKYILFRDGVEIVVLDELGFLDEVAQGRYQVVVTDPAGNRATSNMTDLVIAYDNIPDVEIEDVDPDQGTNVKLAWSCEDPAITNYKIKRGNSAFTINQLLFDMDASVTQKVDSTVEKDITYYYRLYYTNITGEHYVDFDPVTPRDELTPDSPTGLIATYIKGTKGKLVGLTWDGVYETGYEPAYDSIIGLILGTLTVDGTLIINPTNADVKQFSMQTPEGKLTLNDLFSQGYEYQGAASEIKVTPKSNGAIISINGEEYKLKNIRYTITSDKMTVRVYNDKNDGKGQWRIEINAQDADIDPYPDGFDGDGGDGNDDTPPARKIVIYRSLNDTDNWEVLSEVDTRDEAYDDSTVNPGIRYYYQLKLVSGNYDSYSNIDDAYPYDDTPPTAPVVTDVPNDRGGQLNVYWLISGVTKLYMYFDDRKELINVNNELTQTVISNLSSNKQYQFAYVVDRQGIEVESHKSVTISPVVDIEGSAAVTDFEAIDVSPNNGDTVQLTWTKSVDDGAGYNDITGYNVYKDGVLIATLPKGSTSYFVGNLLPDWQNPDGYSFKIGALNNQGSEAFSEVKTVVLVDEKAPAIPDPFVFADASAIGTLKLFWKHDGSDLEGFLLYRNGQQYKELSKDMRMFIDSGLEIGQAYTYQIVSVDHVGNRSLKSAPITNKSVNAPRLKEGINLVSIPYYTQNQNIGETIDAEYTIYDWDGNQYKSNSAMLTPGKPYFIKVDKDVDMQLNTPEPLTGDHVINVKQGWNLISNPFVHNINYSSLRVIDGNDEYTLAEAVDRRLITPMTFGLNEYRNDYKEVTVLETFKGSWIKAFKDLQIVYPYSAISMSSMAISSISTIKSTSGWEMDIDVAGKVLTIGQNPNASDKYDGNDHIQPPALFGISSVSDTEVYIPHSDWGIYSGKYRKDISASSGRWDVIINSEANKDITVKLSGIETIPVDSKLVVLDESNNPIEVVDNQFTIKTTKKYETFTITVQSVAADISITNLVNYPNPCNINYRNVTFRFDSNKTGTAMLKIYSITGRELYSEGFNFNNTNNNTKAWSGYTHGNYKVASGIYFYLIKFESDDGKKVTKKGKIVIWNN